MDETVQRQAFILEHIHEGVLVTDPAGVVAFVNAAFTRMAGIPRDRLEGQPLEACIGCFPLLRLVKEASETGGPKVSADFVLGERFVHASASAREGLGDVVTIIQDRTERSRMASELEQARAAADAGNRVKTEFLANMSHEIRTPLNAVLGMTDMLMDTELKDEQREGLETVYRAGESLLAVINDILDFSKIESERVELATLDFDLRTSVEEVGNVMAPRAREKGLDLAVLVHYNVPTRVKGDPGRLKQVLIHLVSNAIKFTESGEVLVRVGLLDLTDKEQTVGFSVSDTGIGVPDAERDRLFLPFQQADASSTRRHGGTGLGLAIVDRIVEAMGGRIRVDARQGGGSVVTFAVRFERQSQGEDAPEWFPPMDLQALKVLLVDPHTTNRTVFRQQLGEWGCVTEDAGTGVQALERLRAAADKKQPFQLALIDSALPGGMDGSQLAMSIRNEKTLPDLPLIMVTSSPRRGDADRVLDAGFDAYLTKPVKRMHLYDAITTVLELQKKKAPREKKTLVTRHTLREASRSRFKILLVEDNLVNQKVASRMLDKLGYGCDIASNGQEAVEAVRSGAYDLVFMDCQMPVMDGYEATGAIRRLEGGNRRTPIVAMTAHAGEENRERCLDAGMDDFVTKPARLADLKTILQKYLDEDKS